VVDPNNKNMSDAEFSAWASTGSPSKNVLIGLPVDVVQ